MTTTIHLRNVMRVSKISMVWINIYLGFLSHEFYKGLNLLVTLEKDDDIMWSLNWLLKMSNLKPLEGISQSDYRSKKCGLQSHFNNYKRTTRDQQPKAYDLYTKGSKLFGTHRIPSEFFLKSLKYNSCIIMSNFHHKRVAVKSFNVSTKAQIQHFLMPAISN